MLECPSSERKEISAGEDVEDRNHLLTATGIVNWCCHNRKEYEAYMQRYLCLYAYSIFFLQ